MGAHPGSTKLTALTARRRRFCASTRCEFEGSCTHFVPLNQVYLAQARFSGIGKERTFLTMMLGPGKQQGLFTRLAERKKEKETPNTVLTRNTEVNIF